MSYMYIHLKLQSLYSLSDNYQFELVMVGVAKQMTHDNATVTFGEIQIELFVRVQCVARITRRNMSNDDDL